MASRLRDRRVGAYLLGLFDGLAGALLGGVVEPAPTGAALFDDGLTTGVFAGVGLLGVLDPTPGVSDFGMRACATRV